MISADVFLAGQFRGVPFGGKFQLDGSFALIGRFPADAEHGADRVEAFDGAVIDHLRIFEAGAVVKIDETDILLLAVVADPSPQADLLPAKRFQALFELPGSNHLHGDSPNVALSARRQRGHCNRFAGIIQEGERGFARESANPCAARAKK